MIELKNVGMHIAAHPELYEPARSNAYALFITGVEELIPAGMEENFARDSGVYLRNIQDTIHVAVDNSSVPHWNTTPIEVKYGNATIKYANAPTWESGTIVLNDFVGARVKDILLALQAQVYDAKTDMIKLATNYKHDWTLVEYNADMTEVIRTWTLKGAWISGLSEDSLSHSNSDKRQVTATVQFDRAIPEMAI